MKLTTKEIMEIIPHRHPFLLIDTIEDLVPGVKATGKKCITYNEPQFAGHFPQEPIMPGVLIIEALAQTGAVAILSKPENKGKIAYFASINNAKFKNKVVPGDTLTLEVEIIKEKGPMGVGRAKATNRRTDFCSRSITNVWKNFDRQPWRDRSAHHPCVS